MLPLNRLKGSIYIYPGDNRIIGNAVIVFLQTISAHISQHNKSFREDRSDKSSKDRTNHNKEASENG